MRLQDFGSYPDGQHVQAVIEVLSTNNEGRGSQSQSQVDVVVKYQPWSSDVCGGQPSSMVTMIDFV